MHAALLAVILLAAGPAAVAAREPTGLIVKLKQPGPDSEVVAAAAAVLAQALQGTQSSATVTATSMLVPGEDSLFLVAAKSPEDAKSLVQELSQHRNVEYAELDKIMSASVMPSDCSTSDCSTADNLYWGQQAIKAPEVWKKPSGFGGTAKLGCVIDTGSSIRHPDLAGLVDASLSVNMCSDPSCSGVAPGVDDNSHGSHTAGIIIANHRNGINTPVGVMDSGRVYGCKFLDSKGQGSTSDAIRCIKDAVSKGVSVLSNSWGGGFTQSLSTAVQEACKAGVLFVVAAGNNGKAMTSDPESYPGRFGGDANYPCVLTVAASATTGARAAFSNYGSPTVEIAAPGSQIFSCLKDGTNGKMSGTSMATPFITGCALGLWNAFPSLTALQVKQALVESGKARPWADIAGGSVDLARAYVLAQSYGGGGGPTPSCTSDATCASRNPSTPFCSSSLGCVACYANSQCPASAPVCSSNACGPCSSDSHCTSVGGFCNYATGGCVQCMSNVQCGGSTPVCINGACRPASQPTCSSSSQCTSPAAPFCAGGACVPCSTDANCAGSPFGPFCVSGGACSYQKPPTGCSTDSQCPSSAPVCNIVTGVCVPSVSGGGGGGGCASDSSCASSPDTPMCDTSSGKCVACLAPEHCGLNAGWTAACVNRVCQEGRCMYYNNLQASCTTLSGTVGTCTSGRCTESAASCQPKNAVCTKHKDCCSKKCGRKKMQCN